MGINLLDFRFSAHYLLGISISIVYNEGSMQEISANSFPALSLGQRRYNVLAKVFLELPHVVASNLRSAITLDQ